MRKRIGQNADGQTPWVGPQETHESVTCEVCVGQPMQPNELRPERAPS